MQLWLKYFMFIIIKITYTGYMNLRIRKFRIIKRTSLHSSQWLKYANPSCWLEEFINAPITWPHALTILQDKFSNLHKNIDKIQYHYQFRFIASFPLNLINSFSWQFCKDHLGSGQFHVIKQIAMRIWQTNQENDGLFPLRGITIIKTCCANTILPKFSDIESLPAALEK